MRTFFTNSDSIIIYLICKQSVSVIEEYIIIRHYNIKHGKIYDTFVGKLREEKFLYKYRHPSTKKEIVLVQVRLKTKNKIINNDFILI